MVEVQDPFVLDEVPEPFADALIVQFVSSGKILLRDRLEPGFFTETPEAPGPSWEPARLTTARKAVDGWAISRITLAPVAMRFRWIRGQPGAWAALDHYEEGARGHAQVLGVLQGEPVWIVLTAKGLASRDLIRAFRAHEARVARRFRAPRGKRIAPFVAWMTLAVGEGRRMPAGVVYSLSLVEGEMATLPVELGWVIRERYTEAIRWKAAWGGNGGNGDMDAADAPEAAEEALPAPDIPAAALSAPADPQEAFPSAPEAAPVEEDAEGPGPDAEAALTFLLGQGGPEAIGRLRRAFPDLPEDPASAVRALAQTQPQAAFWRKTPQALDLFLAWAERIPALAREAPARIRALKERLGIVPAVPREDEDLTRLAALAALRWLFRPAEREGLEALLREP